MSLPTYSHRIDYVGTFEGRAVSGSIDIDTIPNSPTDGARLVYHELTGRDLERRRKPWRVFPTTDPTTGAPIYGLILTRTNEFAAPREGSISFRVERIRIVSDSEYLACLERVAAPHGLMVRKHYRGAPYMVTHLARDRRTYGKGCDTLEQVAEVVGRYARLDADGRHDLASTWDICPVDVVAPALTFADGISTEACEIVSDGMDYCALPFRVVVWRPIRSSLLAWSTDPRAVDRLTSAPRGGIANRAVYHVDDDGHVTVETAPARGLPLYLDPPSPVLASPVFAGRAVPAGSDWPVTFEPSSDLARAWRAYRDCPSVGGAVSTAEEIVRRYMALRRRPHLGAVEALAEVRKALHSPSIPYPPHQPSNPLVGAPFAHCDPDPNCRWVDDPEALGFREIETGRNDRVSWYCDDECRETMESVVYRLPHGRVVAGYRNSDSDGVVLDLSTTWDSAIEFDIAAAWSWASSLAECAAEARRLENEAFQAGQRVAGLEEEVADKVKRIREIYRTLSAIWARLRSVGLTKEHRALCRDKAEEIAREIEERRREIDRLENEWTGDDQFEEARKWL